MEDNAGIQHMIQNFEQRGFLFGALGWDQDRVLVTGQGEERTPFDYAQRRLGSREIGYEVAKNKAILNDRSCCSSGVVDKNCLSYSPYNQKVNKMGTL